MFLHLLKFNPNHHPKGSPVGGQFAPKNTEGAVQGSPQVTQVLAKNHNRPVTVAEVFRELTPDEQERINALDRNVSEKYAAGMSTHRVWTRNHDGKHYLPQRLRIHKELLNDIKKGYTNEKGERVPGMDDFKAKEGETPLLTILGGRGGSGKSQLKGLGYNEPGTPQSFVLDGDEIKALLSKRVNHGEWNGAEAGLWHEEGDHLVEQLAQYAKANKINLVMDLTLKSNKTGKALAFRDAGYDLKGAYMFLPPKMAATRSARRALAAGGRYVPTDVIVGKTGPDGKQKGGNYNNERNFDNLTRYFNKGFVVYHNMVTWPEPPVLVVDHRKSNPYFGMGRKKRKGDFLSLLKFNQNHDPANGRFTTSGIGGSEFNDHDRKIIDLKPDTRPLTDPKAVRLLSHILPGSTYVPYTRMPFFNAMMKMQGTNIETSTGKEQKAARNALLEQQPVGRVRISDLTFTQNVVHSQTVTDFKKKGGAPIQVARYKGKMYLLDGHHRVAKVALDGGKMLPAYILDMDKVHKFNPNHDELGRFSTSPGTGQGVSFVSPNVREGLQVPDAVGAIGSSRHREVVAISAEVDALLGLRSKHESGVGAWSDGAEDTMLGRIYGNPTYDQVRLSAAMKGMLADQKAVIPFKVDRNGPDSLYKIKVSATDMAQVHETFLKAGLEFHTLVPHGEHTDVYVFDPGTELKQKVQEAGARHGTELSQWRGRGEFLGSWDTRQEGRQAYQAVIDAHLGPDRRGAWERLHSRWRKTHPTLKGLTVPTLHGILRQETIWLR